MVVAKGKSNWNHLCVKSMNYEPKRIHQMDWEILMELGRMIILSVVCSAYFDDDFGDCCIICLLLANII